MSRLAPVLLLAACAAQPGPRAPSPLEPIDGARARRGGSSPWRALVRDALPTPIRDVAALGGARAVVAAGGALFVTEGEGRFRRVCAEAQVPGDDALAVEASAERFVAIGGSDLAPTLWRAEALGARCVRAVVPPLSRTAPERPLGVAYEGDAIWLWSSRGGVLRSTDGGVRWVALPSLPGVRRVFAGADDATYAVVSEGPDEGERSVARHRARIVRLDELDDRDPHWRVVVEDRLVPAAASRADDGRTFVADASGALTLDAAGRVREGQWLPWARSAADAPRVIVPVSGDRFFASADRLLFRVDGGALQPLGLLPGDRRPTSIDASPDGALWASDGRSLWHGRFDARWVELTRRPWSFAQPVAAAAAGANLAVATDDGALAISADDGARWTTVRLPDGLGRVLAMAFDARGSVLALGARAMALGDARRMVPLDAPTQDPALHEAASVHAVGDRWVIVRGGVWTSDDDGARWVPRFGNEFQRATERGGAPITALDVRFRGGRALLLDGFYGLWRSDDAGETWRPVAEASTCPIATRNPWGAGRSFLLWDGGARVGVLGRNALALSEDGGRSWTVRDANFHATAATLSPQGAPIVAVERAWTSARLCARGEGAALLASHPQGFALAREACAHRGVLAAFDADGADAVVISASGEAWRAPLDALVDVDAPTLF